MERWADEVDNEMGLREFPLHRTAITYSQPSSAPPPLTAEKRCRLSVFEMTNRHWKELKLVEVVSVPNAPLL